MPTYVPEPPESNGGRRQGTLTAIFFVLALTAAYAPEAGQQRLSWALRASVLRPFIGMQRVLADTRLRARDAEALQQQLDSVTSFLASQGAVYGENQALRRLLALSDRLGSGFRAASVLRPGTPGSESMFLIDLGDEDGVRPGAPVVSAQGLVGQIREVRAGSAVGIDWTHPDFRASAMLADESAFGIVENRRGAFREGDRLVLNGTAYHEVLPQGMVVVTSGLGGVFPRGIPIGKVDGVADMQAQWLKSYWLVPMVEPASVTHVLVAVDISVPNTLDAWAAASSLTRADAIRLEHARADSIQMLRDSIAGLLRGREPDSTRTSPRGPGR